jgi:hypothetical protein
MFGDKFFTGVGYPTPVSIPDETTCLTLMIPADGAWWALTLGLLYTLTLEWNWQQFEGGISREDAVARWVQMFDQAVELAATTNTCTAAIEYPTPYWDDATDVDDSADVEDQVWYGEVADAEAPPAELSFTDNVGIWLLTGFIAYSGDIGAALFSHTIAPRFVLAWRRGDVGEVIRIVVDSSDYATVDTSGYSPGDVIEYPVVADSALSSHDMYVIKVS